MTQGPFGRDRNRIQGALNQLSQAFRRRDFPAPPGVRRGTSRPSQVLRRVVHDRWEIIGETTATATSEGGLRITVLDQFTGKELFKQSFGRFSREEAILEVDNIAHLMRQIPRSTPSNEVVLQLDRYEPIASAPAPVRRLAELQIEVLGIERDDAEARQALSEVGLTLRGADQIDRRIRRLSVRSTSRDAISQAGVDRALAALRTAGFRIQGSRLQER